MLFCEHQDVRSLYLGGCCESLRCSLTLPKAGHKQQQHMPQSFLRICLAGACGSGGLVPVGGGAALPSGRPQDTRFRKGSRLREAEVLS